MMPSKGIDFYSYIALPSTEIRFTGPNVTRTSNASNNFTNGHLEIEADNPSRSFTGTFQWDVIRNGSTICTRKQHINSLTGNLDGGDFTNIMTTPAVVGPGYTITYGYYHSGSGISGLTKSDQAWVTVTPSLSDWMGDVTPNGSTAADKPFSTFVLAAAHDAGMNTTDGIKLVTNDVASPIFLSALSVLLPVPGIVKLLETKAVDIMIDLAMTQKDSFASMLENGVRYFDFRPAYLLPAVRKIVSTNDDTLYHTHLVIPGARFDTFLNDVVSFLKAHPTEIVVVRTCADGIKVCEVPSSDVITRFAVQATQGSGITLGDRSSFQKPISALRASGTRIILVQSNPKYDSYSDGAYATLNPTTIVDSFAQMNSSSQQGKDFTVLQCQGTCTSIKDVIVYTAATASKSNSPLMSTKAKFDESTLPWIRENALRNLTANQNIIIMNDFIDGATTHTAFELSQMRFASTPSAAVASSEMTSQVAATHQTASPRTSIQVQKSAFQQFSGAGVSQLQAAGVGSSPQLGAQVGGSQSQSAQAGASQAQTAPSGAATGFLHTTILDSAFVRPSGPDASPSQQPEPALAHPLFEQKNAIQQFSGAGSSQTQSAQVGSSLPSWGQGSGSQSQAARSGSAQTGGFPSNVAGGFLHPFGVKTAALPPTESDTLPSIVDPAQAKAQDDLEETKRNEALLRSVIAEHSARS
ncbi:hypothetical protein SCHPADRAFT_634261 [Schizopora paradoxa]|uniref:PLC-like phosphodiesterase n=1 Tax=Schizopora paradoxa TaxID=27342 RepID=A0A0H2R8S5_9AGAM|nr:hypothetical protein SCHPADRAFT_634261 [Schizopora paradoxa]